MKQILINILGFLLLISATVQAQQPTPTYKLSMPNLVGFPDAIEEGETYNLSIKMFNTGNVRFFVGDKVQMHIKIGNYPAENIGSEITLTDEIFPTSAGTGLLDSLKWEVPGYQFSLDKFGGGTTNDIIVWPTVMRAGNLLDPTPDSAYKAIFYVTGAAFRVNNSYISGMSGAVQYGGAYMIDVRTENVGISSNTQDIVFYAQIDNDELLKVEILRLSDNVQVGGMVGSTIQTFKPYLLFPNANLTSGQHYLNIYAIEQGLNNMVQKAIYPIISGTFPVALKSFLGEAEYVKNKIQLEWITEHEASNKEFRIQKYNNTSLLFENIVIVEGKGNNTGTATYNIDDANPYQGSNHYRLIQKDIDGTTQILETITVNYQVDALRLISISPNPSADEIHIQLFNGLSESIKIELYDSKGTQVFLKKAEYPKGTVDISMNIAQLPQGIYFYKIFNIYNTYTGSIMKQ